MIERNGLVCNITGDMMPRKIPKVMKKRFEIDLTAKFPWTFRFKSFHYDDDKKLKKEYEDWIIDNIEYPFELIWENYIVSGIRFKDGNDAQKYKENIHYEGHI